MLILSGAPQLCVQMHHAKQRRQRIHPVNSSQRRGCGQRCGAEMGKNSTSTSVPGPTNEERRLVIPVGDKEVRSVLYSLQMVLGLVPAFCLVLLEADASASSQCTSYLCTSIGAGGP